MAEKPIKAVCAFCGDISPIDLKAPGATRNMAEHIAECKKHPMRAAVLAASALRECLKEGIALFEMTEEAQKPGTDSFVWVNVAKELVK